MIGLVGETRARFLLDTGISIDTVEAEYLKMLRADLGYKYSGFSPIHNPDKNEIHFNLAYATNHHSGMDVLRKAEFQALSIHDKNRFKKKNEKSGGDLFSEMLDEMDILGPYQKQRNAHREEAANVLLRLLEVDRDGIKFGKLAACAQQSLFLKQSEIGNCIVKLADLGQVNAPWLERNGRTPKPEDVLVCLSRTKADNA